jgi:hypothetical protein
MANAIINDQSREAATMYHISNDLPYVPYGTQHELDTPGSDALRRLREKATAPNPDYLMEHGLLVNDPDVLDMLAPMITPFVPFRLVASCADNGHHARCAGTPADGLFHHARCRRGSRLALVRRLVKLGWMRDNFCAVCKDWPLDDDAYNYPVRDSDSE